MHTKQPPRQCGHQLRIRNSLSKRGRGYAPSCQANTPMPSSRSRLSASHTVTAWESFEVQGFGYNTVVTRPSKIPDAYPVADVHVSAFYPSSGLLKPCLRFDHVLSLIIGERLDGKADQGRCFICFVADGRSKTANGRAQSAETGQSQDCVPQVLLRTLLKLLGGEKALDYWGVPHTERGMLGAVVFDTLGFHIPGIWSADKGWERRRNIGYISNLAVAPGARRQGIARRLVARCEQVALADEQIEAVALHVDGKNGAGQKLYEACGYELVTRGSEWKALLGINQTGTGLDLMVKRLRPSSLS